MSRSDKFFESHAWARWISAALVVGVLWVAFEVGDAKVRDHDTRRGVFLILETNAMRSTSNVVLGSGADDLATLSRSPFERREASPRLGSFPSRKKPTPFAEMSVND